MQRKVGARQQHKDGRHHLDHRLIDKISETGIVGGEAADGDGRKAVTYGIKEIHARQPVADDTEHGQTKIDIPERLGRLGDTRCQFAIFHRSRRLGTIELHTANTEHR